MKIYIDGRDNVEIKKQGENHFVLKDMSINYCTGCWDCWLKTPGVCRLKDDHNQIIKQLVKSDEWVFISNVRTGFITSTLKKTIDRIVQIVLPYIRIYEGECHHFPRYDLAPKVKIVVDGDVLTTESELLIEYFKRAALNFNGEFDVLIYEEEITDVDF